MKFKDILSNKEIIKSIEDAGFDSPTDIQSKVIPLILDGNDVLGQSQTGTGKTLAFGAPIISNIEDNGLVQALVLAPTRELAIQISKELEKIGRYTDISISCVYGSSSISEQIKALKAGCEIVIGTPGRVKDLINRKVLKINNIKYFVLDEADEMLSMGFKEELVDIFEHTNKDKQVLMFSATMPKTILEITKKYMAKDYEKVSIVGNSETADNIDQYYYLVDDNTRLEAMCRCMDFYNPKRAIIFCRTKRNADLVYEKLSVKGYNADIIHGDITQEQRIATLDRFKKGTFNYLIATDVAARGIHVDDVEIILNYNMPESDEAYVHRIGRTGRASKSGIAITFVKSREENLLTSLEKRVKSNIIKKNIPSRDSIIESRIGNIVDISNKLKEINYSNTSFANYINTLSNDDTLNLLGQLLEKKLISSLGSDFNNNVNVSKKKRNTRNDDDSIRVFLTIGKMDKLDKREFLKFIEKRAAVPMNTCTSVEIMTKFTFMSVRKKYFDQVLSKCNNMKYKGRIVKIEKAKK